MTLCLVALAAAAVMLTACSNSGEGGREILIVQTDEGCTPDSVPVSTGEKLKLTGQNETGNIYELEGTNGTQLEELIVPEGKSRSIGYTVPNEPGTYDVKCYQPGGVSTIVKLVAGDDLQSTDPADDGGDSPVTRGGNDNPADTTVAVDLTEYAVEPSAVAVAAGNIQFDTTNSGDEVHELYVLRIQEEGGFDVIGEIEDVEPGASGTIRLQLEPGDYQLACLIVPGEAGSTVDHYQEGMLTEFTVE
jgi:plastocyanin